MRPSTVGLATVCLAVAVAGSGAAQELRGLGSSVGVTLPGAAGATLTVTGPDGFYRQTSSRGRSVALQLGAAARLPDGIYYYEVTAATAQKVPNRNTLDNGRGQEPAMVNVGVTRSGTFTVKNGAIVQTPTTLEGAGGDRDG